MYIEMYFCYISVMRKQIQGVQKMRRRRRSRVRLRNRNNHKQYYRMS